MFLRYLQAADKKLEKFNLHYMQLTAGYPFWLINYGLLYYYPKLLANVKVNTGGNWRRYFGCIDGILSTNAGIDCMLVGGRTIGLVSTCASTALLQYKLAPSHRAQK